MGLRLTLHAYNPLLKNWLDIHLYYASCFGKSWVTSTSVIPKMSLYLTSFKGKRLLTFHIRICLLCILIVCEIFTDMHFIYYLTTHYYYSSLLNKTC